MNHMNIKCIKLDKSSWGLVRFFKSIKHYKETFVNGLQMALRHILRKMLDKLQKRVKIEKSFKHIFSSDVEYVWIREKPV